MSTFDPLTAAFELGKTALEKIWPDPNKRAIHLHNLEALRQKGDLAELNAHVQLMLGQIENNQIDAKSARWYQAGWRPAIGWVGAISLFLMFVPKAIMMTVIWSWQNIVIITNTLPADIAELTTTPFPDLGTTDIIGLLVSMLGVAGMRSYDKKQKTDTR